MTAEEIAAQREAAQAAKQPLRIRSPWRDRTDGDADQPFVVRLRAPRDGATTIEDQVQGAVTVQNAELDDLVLLRSDGTPTYMLAVVVDDHDMGVTHVIRGDDHLNNAFRQLPIYRAMGWPEPVYAHIPLIHGADGAKLSKRHGAVGVEAYRDDWASCPRRSTITSCASAGATATRRSSRRDQAVEWFDLGAVGKAPSRFDLKKLENLNGHYIREADDAAPRRAGRRRAGVRPRRHPARRAARRAMPALKPRAANLNELRDGARLPVRRPPAADRTPTPSRCSPAMPRRTRRAARRA